MVLFQIDIPFTLILMSLGILATIGIVAFITYEFLKFKKQIKTVLTSVPMLSPESLQDLEERAQAIDDFNHGDRKAIQMYWRKFYAKKEKN